MYNRIRARFNPNQHDETIRSYTSTNDAIDEIREMRPIIMHNNTLPRSFPRVSTSHNPGFNATADPILRTSTPTINIANDTLNSTHDKVSSFLHKSSILHQSIMEELDKEYALDPQKKGSYPVPVLDVRPLTDIAAEISALKILLPDERKPFKNSVPESPSIETISDPEQNDKSDGESLESGINQVKQVSFSDFDKPEPEFNRLTRSAPYSVLPRSEKGNEPYVYSGRPLIKPKPKPRCARKLFANHVLGSDLQRSNSQEKLLPQPKIEEENLKE